MNTESNPRVTFKRPLYSVSDKVTPEDCPYCGESQMWVEHDICASKAQDLLLTTELQKN